MGRALQLPGSNAVLAAHPKLTFQRNGYSYVVETKDGQSSYSVSDGNRAITVPIRWSFGNRAQTWLFERNGVYFESMVSYYPEVGGLAVTIGDSDIAPKTLEEAVGRRVTPNEPAACFGCHSTNSVEGGHVLTLDSLEPGVTCEHCHAGAAAHALSGDASETAPGDLRKLSTEDLSDFCGQCHRSWEKVVRGPWRGEITVRFQPYRLAGSKCYSGTDPRISCIACHDPHKDLVTDVAAYDSKCLACHEVKGATRAVNSKATAPACPMEKGNCVNCHMPEVKLADGAASFRDHRIRVVKTGTVYPD